MHESGAAVLLLYHHAQQQSMMNKLKQRSEKWSPHFSARHDKVTALVGQGNGMTALTVHVGRKKPDVLLAMSMIGSHWSVGRPVANTGSGYRRSLAGSVNMQEQRPAGPAQLIKKSTPDNHAAQDAGGSKLSLMLHQ